MKILLFLAEWALRSSVLILCGAGLVWVLRVKDAFVRLTAWIALLVGSLVIPALTLILPRVPIMAMHSDLPLIQQAPSAFAETLPEPVQAAARHFDWAQIAVVIYAAVVLLLLLRLLVGVVVSRRLIRDSVTTSRAFRESDRVAAPVTLGILRPVLVLPSDWREWGQTKLDAVLAHERSHIRRHDPAVQMLSAIHRAVLWISPLSWFLHNRIVRAAEEVSDDAAVAATRDRAFYAEVLLGFMQRGLRGANWLGVSMSRYGRGGSAHPSSPGRRHSVAGNHALGCLGDHGPGPAARVPRCDRQSFPSRASGSRQKRSADTGPDYAGQDAGARKGTTTSAWLPYGPGHRHRHDG